MGAIFECTIVISFKGCKTGLVRLAFSLKRYDHVSDYYKQLHWLPWIILLNFVLNVRCTNNSICCIPLEPPIHSIWEFPFSLHQNILIICKNCSIQIELFSKVFCYRVTQWWNSLPSLFANLPFNTFVNAVQSHLKHCDTLGT